jgi:hypothetical protein
MLPFMKLGTASSICTMGGIAPHQLRCVQEGESVGITDIAIHRS